MFCIAQFLYHLEECVFKHTLIILVAVSILLEVYLRVIVVVLDVVAHQTVICNFTINKMVRYKFVQCIVAAFGIVSVLSTIPFFSKCLQVIKVLNAVLIVCAVCLNEGCVLVVSVGGIVAISAPIITLYQFVAVGIAVVLVQLE